MAIYLDNNATTQVLPEIAQFLAQRLLETPMNTGSPHSGGRRAKELLEAAEAGLLEVLGLQQSHRVVFTSGATESINLALKGTRAAGSQRVHHLSIDHPALVESALGIGANYVIPVSEDGDVDLRALDRVEAGDLVAFHSANNETGQVIDIAGLTQRVRERGGLVCIDASQSPAKEEGFFARVADSQPDMLVLSGHKMHAPIGIGAFIVRRGLAMQPLLHGGSQGHGMRAGTEAVWLAESLHLALKHSSRVNFAEMRLKRDRLAASVVKAGGQLTILGKAPCLDNTLHYRLPGVEAQRQVIAYDLAGVQGSATSACASGSLLPSHAMLGMGFDEASAREGVRLCISSLTLEEEITRACGVIEEVLGRLGARGPRQAT